MTTLRATCPHCGAPREPASSYYECGSSDIYESNACCARQLARADNALADWHEHEDTAPHEGCTCKLCTALASVQRMRAVLDNVPGDVLARARAKAAAKAAKEGENAEVQ